MNYIIFIPMKMKKKTDLELIINRGVQIDILDQGFFWNLMK